MPLQVIMTASPRGLGCVTTYRAYSSDEAFEIMDSSRIGFIESFAPKESLIPVKVLVSTFPGEGDVCPDCGTFFLKSLPLDPYLDPHAFEIGSDLAMLRTVNQAVKTFSCQPVSSRPSGVPTYR